MESGESSPDPFRNIAQDAYQVAQKRAISSAQPTNEKKAIVDELANRLYEEASNPQ
jgi:hypothetical protein